MSMEFRRLAIRVLLPVSWRLFPRRIALNLHTFSRTEADTAFHMFQALPDLEDPEYRAKLFNNTLEEVNHAALFLALATKYADSPLPKVDRRHADLYSSLDDLTLFQTYHFVGETDVYNQFHAYAGAAPQEDVKKNFLRCRTDEEGHQALAMEQLVAHMGSERAAWQQIRRLRIRRVWYSWCRFFRGVADMASGLVLGLLYFAAGPFLFWACRRRLSSDDWSVYSSGPLANADTGTRGPQPVSAQSSL